MRIALLFFFCASIAVACASSEKNSDTPKMYPYLVTLTQPEGQQEESVIYVDSVELISYNNSKALLISGSFPDGCTQIKDASHTVSEKLLHVNLAVWRDPNRLCSQALTPFSFIYDLVAQDNLSGISSVKINDKNYQVY